MYYIYVLKCPITNVIRYVGQTRVGIVKRLRGHIYESTKVNKKHSYKDNWISKLLKLELKPIIEVIEEISLEYDVQHVLEREKFWILKYKSYVNLLNATDGGEFSINNRQGKYVSMIGENNPMWNKKHKQISKDIMSEKLKGLFNGENNPMWNKKHKQTTKDIMREKKIGVYDGINNPRAKEIYQYDKNLTLIKKWDYAKECADFYKISRGNISSSAKYNTTKKESDKYITCSGFIFSFCEF